MRTNWTRLRNWTHQAILPVFTALLASGVAAQAPVTLDELTQCGHRFGARAMVGDDSGTWLQVRASDELRVSRSTDGGETWNSAHTIPEPFFGGGGGFVDASVGHQGIALASDGTGRWMLAVTRVGYFNNSCLCSPTCSGWEGEDDKGAQQGAAAASNNGLKCEEWDEFDTQVYVSVDDGATWSNRSGPLGEYYFVVVERLFHLGGDQWCMLMRNDYPQSPHFLRSEDGGVSWTEPTAIHPQGMGAKDLLAAGHVGGGAIVLTVLERFTLDGGERVAVSAIFTDDVFETLTWQRLFTFSPGVESGIGYVSMRPGAVVRMGGARWLATWTRGAGAAQPGVLMGARSLDHGRTWSAPFDMGQGVMEGSIAGNAAGSGIVLSRVSGPDGHFGFSRFHEPRFQLGPLQVIAGSEDDHSTSPTYPTVVHGSGKWLGSWSLEDRPLCHSRMRIAGIAEAALTPGPHSLDLDGNGAIGLSELLRAIQIYNSSGYRCAAEDAEDGYAPGENADEQTCAPHTGDYLPQDWQISLGELLRIIQLYAFGAYHAAPDTEDGFAPGADTGV